MPPTLDGEQYAVTELKPQTATTGWLAFAVPDPPEAPRVRWEHAYDDGAVAVEWTVQ